MENTKDEKYEEAKEIVIKTRKASAAFLQRKLQTGYARSSLILEDLEREGVIGPHKGSRMREILV